MNYGKIIKKLRKERNLTQEQLCKGITSRISLSDFETKNTRISFETLTLYLNRMNIRLDEFVLLYVSEDLPFMKKRKIANQLQKLHSLDQKLSCRKSKTCLKDIKKQTIFIITY